MNRVRWYYYKPSRFLELRDPPDPADPEGEGGEPAPAEPAVVKAHEIEGLPSLVGNQVKKVLSGMGVVTKGDLDGIVDRITGSLNVTPAPTPAPSPDPAPAADPPADGDGNQTPVETQLRRLQAELQEERRGRQKLESNLADEKQTASVEKRNNSIRAIANKLGADDPNDVLMLVQDRLVEDEERGWVFEFDGEFGKEFAPPEEFLEQFLDKKPHLKKVRPRTGSGAGDGSEPDVVGAETVDGRRISDDNLKDPEWYRENRAKIHKKMNARMQNYRVNRGAVTPRD